MVATMTPVSLVANPSRTEENTRKTYATTVEKPKYGRNIDASSLPTPGMQGEYPTICLIEEEVDRGEKWALSGECLITPLGRWYIMFKFDKEEDYAKLGATVISSDIPEPSIDDLADQVVEVLNFFGLGVVMCLGVTAGAYVLTLFAVCWIPI
ncbi:hypothetical protein IFM89_003595 [Coptis chinensis]|uniref:Uncharacterized protein n=1 Tax=Coptis chinensis TaxID=261450 RepID=A0A835HY89_9MAGN|nr:hypothetical protein IFM89_003595 [Coptis chinensis]